MYWPNLKPYFRSRLRLSCVLTLLLIGGLAAGPVAAANVAATNRTAAKVAEKNRPMASSPVRRQPAPPVFSDSLLPVTPQSLFFDNCAPCHGDRGGGRIGPRVAARNWTAKVFNAQVRQGGLVMPAFSPARISDAQLADMLAWVNAMPAPPAAAQLPAPDSHAPGAAVFQANCLACHGVEARGGIAPGILNTALSYTRFLAQVRHGGGMMPAFAPAQISPLPTERI